MIILNVLTAVIGRTTFRSSKYVFSGGFHRGSRMEERRKGAGYVCQVRSAVQTS